MVIRASPSNTWKVIPASANDDYGPEVNTFIPSEPEMKGQKRKDSPSALNEQDLKRRCLSPSTSSDPCLAPPPNTVSEQIYDDLRNGTESLHGSGDVFLTVGFRQRWCRCAACIPSLQENTFLLEEEDTYEPPDDPDCGLSLEELGMRALARLPRDRAIDGIHAFNAMREDLVQFLRPFAEDGQVVAEADVKNFFDELREKQKGHSNQS
ncbi:hypothetical protein MPER_11286 [Moniliophthora perniciosa FA553]|nr:hypothetical protein MPER_11286 [Moniliophthora perniciosa FA553]